jgi:hypothetical protein
MRMRSAESGGAGGRMNPAFRVRRKVRQARGLRPVNVSDSCEFVFIRG